MEIIFILKDGTEKIVSASKGQTLLEVMEEHDIPVTAVCSGGGVCGTCNVKIESASAIPSPEDNELDILEMFQYEEGVRLACQIVLDDECDGLRVALP